MLRASGETIEGPRPCDWFDVFVDDAGNLVVLLLDVQANAESSAGFLAQVLRDTRSTLQEYQPLHSVVNGLEMQLAAHPGVEAGLVILRVSQRDARVELLNAGMPAVANAGPAGQLDLYAALSGPIGRRVGEVHPYELLPLRWGGTWLAISDGMINGSRDTENVAALCAKLDLSARGEELASSTGEELYDTFQGLLTATRFVRDDATGVLVATDVTTRFKSGIV